MPGQLSLGVLLSGFVVSLCFPFSDSPGNRSVAFHLLLLTVSILALVFRMEALVLLAVLSALEENSFHPYNTLLNSLSHELPTPIATILGATDNLQNKEERFKRQQKSDLLNEISTASIHQNKQVESLLNMSRLNSGFILPKMDWCDLNELMYKVVDQLREHAKFCFIEVNLEENLPLFKLENVERGGARFPIQIPAERS